MNEARLSVGIVGCGLIGKRRAECAAGHRRSLLTVVCDIDKSAAERVASWFSVEASDDWRRVVERRDVDVLVVSTPNAWLREVASAGLEAGKHVLIEKPMGRNLAEAQSLGRTADSSGRLLKIGFNHRFHPAIGKARKLFEDGVIGEAINVRAVYGHGGRPGYENEWRGKLELAGGGELTDQGVHVVDLLHWFCGMPAEAFSWQQTAVWPLGSLEDNAFGMFRFPDGAIASFHTSWTQWKNRFSYEVFGRKGAVLVKGLGGSYGVESLTTLIRNPAGGVPATETIVFDGPDKSWRLEWDQFVASIFDGTCYFGTPADGIAAMRMIDGLYRSHAANAPASV